MEIDTEMSQPLHTIPPLEKHTHTIILLHGRDSTALEFAPEFLESQASDDRTLPQIFPTIKWVFPTSQIRNSQRFETGLSQWFDIWSVENPSEKEELQKEGLRESVIEIAAVVTREAEVVGPERVILGGISQGAAVAVHALMYGGVRLGAFVGLCTWLPLQAHVENIAIRSSRASELQQARGSVDGAVEGLGQGVLTGLPSSSPLDTPVFLAHAVDDEVVPIDNGRNMCETLKRLGLSVEWREYEDGGHWFNEPQGVDDMVAFLLPIVEKEVRFAVEVENIPGVLPENLTVLPDTSQ
jgi:lysophospholipase-2